MVIRQVQHHVCALDTLLGKEAVFEVVRLQQHKGEVGLKNVTMFCPKNA